MEQLDHMTETVHKLEEKFFESNEMAVPSDDTFVQVDSSQQFIGNVLWDAFNLITFGAFEKKKTKKP